MGKNTQFRKGFEEDTTITPSDKEQVLSFLKTKMPKTSADYQKLKSQVDKQEFLTTDYYASPYPKKFRGAYAPVVLKTFAGIMSVGL